MHIFYGYNLHLLIIYDGAYVCHLVVFVRRSFTRSFVRPSIDSCCLHNMLFAWISSNIYIVTTTKVLFITENFRFRYFIIFISVCLKNVHLAKYRMEWTLLLEYNERFLSPRISADRQLIKIQSGNTVAQWLYFDGMTHISGYLLPLKKFDEIFCESWCRLHHTKASMSQN